jgi:hypothetical protein
MEGMQAKSHGRDLASLRAELRNRDPRQIAEQAGARFFERESALYMSFWGVELRVDFPEFTVSHGETRERTDDATEKVIIHYFHTADGSERGDDWVSLADLPNGSFYRHAYQGYSGDYLASLVQNDLDSLAHACRELGGRPESFGDLAYSFHVLPRIDLLLVYHRGDDEFPPSAQALFSSSASHFLPTDLYAHLGRQLVLKILEVRT